MNIKRILPALLLGCAISAYADGYTDGIEYYKAGMYDKSKTILERNLGSASTDKALSYYYLGQIDLIKGDKAAAKANFDKGVAANPECAYNYVGLGALALQNNDARGAEDLFKQAMKLDKKNQEVTVDIARSYYNADKVKYDKKVTEYLAKARKESKNTEPSIYILEGDMIFDQLNPDLIGDAAARYEMAISFDKDNPEGYVKYANAYIGVNPQYSVSKLEELVQKQPNSALALSELGEKYYENKLWTKAADTYGRYIQNPNHFPSDKSRYATLLYANQEYEKSLQQCNDFLANDPDNLQMLRVKMLDLYELGRYDDAIAASDKLFAHNLTGSEKFTQIDYTTAAQAYSAAERHEDAIGVYRKLLEQEPSRADILKLINQEYSAMKDYQQAAEAFDQAVAVTEEPSINDYYQLAAQWLVAANDANDRAANDPGAAALRLEDADKGIMAMQHVLDAVDAGTIQATPAYYQRMGLLYFIRNGMKADEPAAQAYTKLVEVLDADPANMSNDKTVAMYRQAYQILNNYYSGIKDKEKAARYSDLLKALP